MIQTNAKDIASKKARQFKKTVISLARFIEIIGEAGFVITNATPVIHLNQYRNTLYHERTIYITEASTGTNVNRLNTRLAKVVHGMMKSYVILYEEEKNGQLKHAYIAVPCFKQRIPAPEKL